MKIIAGTPPNYKEIIKRFPAATKKGVIFTYGDTIYNPSNFDINAALMAHEMVHSQRQKDNPDDWWNQYLIDNEFRYQEELLAHITEYVSYYKYGRNVRRTQIKLISERLSSPLYGNVVNTKEAKQTILLAAKEWLKTNSLTM